MHQKLSNTFRAFFDSEKSSGFLLGICTVLSLSLANSVVGPTYLRLWQFHIGPLTIEHWINEALMAIFFLLIGLELQRELFSGELSEFKNALLPILGALGGICVPALIHFVLNSGTPTQVGIWIPMATDIAFALGALALLGSRVPASLKLFLTALAVMDDVAAIIVIAVFYSRGISATYLIGAMTIVGLLFGLGRVFRVRSLVPYLFGGVLLWYLMLKSGVHSTIAGVLLAFVIPFSDYEDDETSPAYRLECFLQKPVPFLVLPVFALANTCVVFGANWQQSLASTNSAGIIGGLLFGKPLGITLFSSAAVAMGICKLPSGLTWRHIIGGGLLGGIGFTMSIFITSLAYAGNTQLESSSKIAILLASLTAGAIGFLWLRFVAKPAAGATTAG
ncbi:MAG: Na+/H+ antiporter NhaA [bacterium]